MPILNFTPPNAGQQQLIIDITRNRSTDSTVDATGGASTNKAATVVAVVRPSTNRSPPSSPSHAQLVSWRAKELSSIVGAPRSLAPSQEQESMWTLHRCDAFDEDDDDEDY